jgi:MoxR-like ATPase
MKILNKTSYSGFLNKIGIYGMDEYEDIIMIPLITEDPVILMGEYGTGKTQLLNNLAKILGLKHKHYNASLISFEDLIGYPFPDKENKKVEFLKTEASVWDANSILIDEINRCKPETQNKFFSLIHEKKLEGIELKNLIYRWAAMNPPGYIDDDSNSQDYEGVNYLDKALADRFSIFIETPNWSQLNIKDKEIILSNIANEEINPDKDLIKNISLLKDEFKKALKFKNDDINRYSIFVADSLIKAGIDLSSRRIKMIVKNLIALSILTGRKDFILFYNVLRLSIPHKCFGVRVVTDTLKVIHQKAFNQYISDKIDYFHKFLFVRNFLEKTDILMNKIKDPQERGLIISNFINDNINQIYKKAYLYTLFPLLMSGRIEINFQVLELVRLSINDFYLDKIEIDEDDSFLDFSQQSYISSQFKMEDNSKMVNFIKFFLFKIVKDYPDISNETIGFLIREMRNFYKKYYLNQKEEL